MLINFLIYNCLLLFFFLLLSSLFDSDNYSVVSSSIFVDVVRAANMAVYILSATSYYAEEIVLGIF